MLRLYDRCLRWVLGRQPLILAVTIITVCVSVYLATVVPKGFFPQQDTGRFSGAIIGDQDSSYVAITAKMRAFEEIVRNDTAVDTVMAFSGGGSVNQARMFGQLKPLSQRKISTDEVINRLRGKLSRIPGATLFLQVPQDINIGARGSNSQFQYTLQADNLDDLNYWAPVMLTRLKKIPELQDPNSDEQDHGLQSQLVIDRDAASRLGVNMTMIDNTLSDAFGQRQVSNIYEGINQYHVVLEIAPQFQRDPDALKRIYIPAGNVANTSGANGAVGTLTATNNLQSGNALPSTSSTTASPSGGVTPATGTLVPLNAVAHYVMSNTPLQVNHQGIFPSITLSFNIAVGASLGTAVNDVIAAQRDVGLPANVHATFQGTAQAFQQSLSSEPLLVLTALAAVYIVLGILYESYVHPITILSTLPSAGIGALLALLLFHEDLNVIALIGIILLIGIVKKNAILMIDFALQTERIGGKSSVEAIYEACMLRFRPIMMTTMAAMFGAVPLAIGGGVGSELRRPLGITIVGGLIFSQMLTLFTTPVVYLYLDRLQNWRQRHRAAGHVPASTSAD